MKKKLKKEKGITLVALVVTIVVLLILAGVTINMLFSDNGIITKAQEAAQKTEQAEKSELAGMQNVVNYIDKLVNGESSKPVTNPYDPDGWDIAWTCKDGIWSEQIAAGTTIPDDIDVIAKFYKTGNKITPEKIIDMDITFIEGDEYTIVVEGNGRMGKLVEETDTMPIGYAWQKDFVKMMMGQTVDNWIIPYVSEIIVCDGVENIGAYACTGGISLKETMISRSLVGIDDYAFELCNNLTAIDISQNIEYIGRGAFTLGEGNLIINVPDERTEKLVNGSYYGITEKVEIADKSIVLEDEITAEDIKQNPVRYCGKEVIGYTCANDSAVEKWKIFHADDEHIYLIAGDYIDYEYIPTKDGASIQKEENSSKLIDLINSNELIQKYNGAEDITDTKITPWLSYLNSSYGINNTNDNMKGTAYLLDTEIWNVGYKGEKAEYAIGSPTLDMYVASYNSRCGNSIEFQPTEAGYAIRYSGETDFKDESVINVMDYMLSSEYDRGDYGPCMKLASPGSGHTSWILDVPTSVMWTSLMTGLRPVVCLNSSVVLEKTEVNGEVVYNIK